MTPFSLTALTEQLARLRLAADALGVDVRDINLDDLHPLARRELLRKAKEDVWTLVNN